MLPQVTASENWMLPAHCMLSSQLWFGEGVGMCRAE